MEDFLKNRDASGFRGRGNADDSLQIGGGMDSKALNVLGSEAVQDGREDGAVKIPKVDTVSEDGSVKRIIVTCTCGKCIELECKY